MIQAYSTKVEHRAITATGKHSLGAIVSWSLPRQFAWIEQQLARQAGSAIFLFLNRGDYEGAPWTRDDNHCIPFQTIDCLADCRLRQHACLEFVDGTLSSLLAHFAGATIVICSDHGDCWGEDGLWEHDVSHPMISTCPLRYKSPPAASYPNHREYVSIGMCSVIF
jgi:hypothetical protein